MKLTKKQLEQLVEAAVKSKLNEASSQYPLDDIIEKYREDLWAIISNDGEAAKACRFMVEAIMEAYKLGQVTGR